MPIHSQLVLCRPQHRWLRPIAMGKTMGCHTVSLETINDFLAPKRIAMVGISRDPASFSMKLFEELLSRGYDVVPVSPQVKEVLGRPCFARLQDIHPPVDAALLMTSPQITDRVVEDCAQAGIGKVWMYRAGGKGAVSENAVQFCKEHGMQVVPGQCPYMFWPDAAGGHRFHGWIRKITLRYPKRARPLPQ